MSHSPAHPSGGTSQVPNSTPQSLPPAGAGPVSGVTATSAPPHDESSEYEPDSRPMFTRLSTMPDSRILDDPRVKNRPLSQWTIPRSSTGRSSRAATLFLGQDHERWRLRSRDSMGDGLKLAWGWRSGSSSALPDATRLVEGLPSGDEASTESEYTDTFTDEDSEGGKTSFSSPRNLSRRSSRSSHRSRTGSGVWKKAGVHALTAASGHSSTDALESSSGATSSVMETGDGTSSQGSSGFSGRKPRRFSSNGPEAAFLRHETVIGIHTPRRDSSSSMASSAAGRQLPASIDRISLTPLSQIKTGSSPPLSRPPSGSPSGVVPPAALQQQARVGDFVSSPMAQHSPDLGSPARLEKPRRELSSCNLLKKAAAIAAAASVPPSPIVDEPAELTSPASPSREQPLARVASGSSWRSHSPAPNVLKLARRRKPITVDGTLYDRSGPFREGAVTDGLSVRLFSSEHEKEQEGWAADSDEEGRKKQKNGHASSSTKGASRSRRDRKSKERSREGEQSQKAAASQPGLSEGGQGGQEVDDTPNEQAGVPAYPLLSKSSTANTYLITTPDNRVSSAAKLRRWAMDGSGKFYAAMEIKSVEAKIRSAMDPTEARENAAYARSLAKILRSTYLDDILTEIQKAETLNAGRTAVAKLLVTSDGKYIRLEEDYPEESFFVIAGCEEEELYPVVALVFVQALGHIHRFHQAGWLHGDIKLENLMFDSRGELVVIDYENANPFRTPHGDEKVHLMSFDWVPPEAAGSDNDGGRRVGPSADLWALGANLVRAFALRDGIDDGVIRQLILEEQGQKRFLAFRDSLIGVDEETTRATSQSVDLSAILAVGKEEGEALDEDEKQGRGAGAGVATARRSHVTPARLLLPFALSAPHLLQYVLSSCLVLSPEARGVEAELEGLRLADELLKESEGQVMRLGARAVRTAIELSGSEWVRPKLEEARCSLALGESLTGGGGGG